MRYAPSYRSLIENQAAQRTRSAARQGGQTRLPSKRQASPVTRLRRTSASVTGQSALPVGDSHGSGSGSLPPLLRPVAGDAVANQAAVPSTYPAVCAEIFGFFLHTPIVFTVCIRYNISNGTQLKDTQDETGTTSGTALPDTGPGARQFPGRS